MSVLEMVAQLVPAGLYSSVGLIAAALIIVIHTLSNNKNAQPLPPGPPPKPIIGNLLDMPTAEKAQAYYTELGERYGPISSLTILGTTLIIINDYNIARDLLDKRANLYSDRPTMHMLGSLLGMDRSTLLEQCNERFFRLRKIAHGQLGSLTAVMKWRQDVDVEVRRYLLATLDRPAQWLDHLRLQAAAVILKILYGYETDHKSTDPLIMLSRHFAEAVIKTGVPEAYMVDAMPLLRWIPEWFPGAAFKREARVRRQLVSDMAETPYTYTKRQVAAGTASHSAVSDILQAQDQRYTDHDIAWSAASMFGGGADTTLATMEMLFLAMTQYPEVMKKAQDEIDGVIGFERLVSEHDRHILPYTDALFKEVMRWEPLLEVNMPHCVSADDQYAGYHIPKGAMILSNTTGIMHDPTIYSKPEYFRPERFLGHKPEMNPFDLVWGHGRRVCPGRHLAFFTLWLELSRTLQVFDICAVPGKLPQRQFTWGVIRRPLPFETITKIRTPAHEKLVRSVEVEHPTPPHGSKL